MSYITITRTEYVWQSARDAIDAVSAFEASTLDDWEYEIRAIDDDGTYVVLVKPLLYAKGLRERGYLHV